MNFENPSDERIKEMMRQAGHVAIVGLSDNSERTSYIVARTLQSRGYRIIPVNPNVEMILGEKCYPSLSAVPEPIDIVDVFRRSEHMVSIAEESVKVKAKVLWMQLGIVNYDAAAICLENDVKVVMDRCMKIEDAKWNPRL